MPTRIGLMAILVGILVVFSGCSREAADEHGDNLENINTDDPPEIPWTDTERADLLACASGKLGYTLTQELYENQPDNEDGIINTEPEWEGQRQIRAYLQCILENYPDKVQGHPSRETMYLFAYALDSNGKQVVDPLAPWPGKENLPK